MGCHMDELMVVAEDTQSIMDQLTAVYEVAKPCLPSYHLGCNYSQRQWILTVNWLMSSKTQTKETIIKANEILDKLPLGFRKGWKINYYSRKSEKTPMAAFNPELDISKLLDEEHHNSYQHLICILQQLCSIG